MKSSAHLLALPEHSFPTGLYNLKGNTNPQILKFEKSTDECIWQNFLVTNRILHLLRPDYFMIYKYSKSTILFQQNINLDLGTNQVTVDHMLDYLAPKDFEHFRSMDKIMCQMTAERKLQPLDFVFKICGNIECPNPSLKRIMRTSFLIHCSTTGIPELGFYCVHDVTSMVSSIKPNNYDITFDPCHAHLKKELAEKVRSLSSAISNITYRERDILYYINKGMSSKEIAGNLFISKATVDTHRQNMLRKWELPNTAALLKRAREEDWI
ncbi:MAG: LuxR C-terminal-related transcriptional regulator [Saprospiraceae bacterium]